MRFVHNGRALGLGDERRSMLIRVCVVWFNQVAAEAKQEEVVVKITQEKKKEWSLYNSIFYPRLKESYGKSFYDDNSVNDDAFEVRVWGGGLRVGCAPAV